MAYLSNNTGARVFYTGTQKDSETYDKIHSFIQDKLNIEPINFCGKLSIKDSTALINRMNFVIGSDSGTLHIAASLNIPVIGIYGPMNPEKWMVQGNKHKPLCLKLPCIPCDLKKKCLKDIACLKELKPDMVIEKIHSLIL